MTTATSTNLAKRSESYDPSPLRLVKTIPSHAGKSRLIAEFDEPFIVGWIPRQSQIPSPYDYGPTDGVHSWNGRRVIVRETSHKRYQVFELPPEMPIYSDEEEATQIYLARRRGSENMARGTIRVDRRAHARRGYVRADGTQVRPTSVSESTFTIADPGRPGRGARGAKRGPHAGEPAWIGKEGALGGPGFASKSTKARRAILARSASADGYRTTLGRVSVLLRSTQLHPETRKRLESDRVWLVEKFGGPGSFAKNRAGGEEWSVNLWAPDGRLSESESPYRSNEQAQARRRQILGSAYWSSGPGKEGYSITVGKARPYSEESKLKYPEGESFAIPVSKLWKLPPEENAAGANRARASTFPHGARVLVDGRDEAIVRGVFPGGSSSFLFPHYKLDFIGGDRNVAVAMSRVGVDRARRGMPRHGSA